MSGANYYLQSTELLPPIPYKMLRDLNNLFQRLCVVTRGLSVHRCIFQSIQPTTKSDIPENRIHNPNKERTTRPVQEQKTSLSQPTSCLQQKTFQQQFPGKLKE